jgi:hypothetical protein
MNFVFTPALQDYMKQKKKDTLVVELVEVNGDFDFSELHVHLPDAKRVEFFRTKKNYRAISTDCGTVLLPRFPLELADTVTFGLKSVLWFRTVTYEGIKL